MRRDTECKAVVSLAAKRRRQTRNGPFLPQGPVMQIAGKQIKRTRLIQTEKYVVAVEV
jgi:hypothetical protein